MKFRTLAAALCAGAALIAGCGGDDEPTTESVAPATVAEIDVEAGPFETEEDFTAAVNDYCSQVGEIYSRAPIYGISPAGLEAEFTRLVEVEQEDAARLEEFEAPEAIAEEWDAFLEANAELNATHEEVLDAAAAGDAEEANAVLAGDATKAVEDLGEASAAAGVECVDEERELSEAEPAPATEAAAGAPQPSNSIDQAAEDWLTAQKSGDCETLADALHTQTGVTPEALADPSTGDCQPQADGFVDAQVAATSQWGPVGHAAIEVAPGQFGYAQFIIDPEKGNELRNVNLIYADTNGLDAPNEGYDADETASSFVEAIRADDVDAFNDALSIEAEAFVQKGNNIESLGTDPDYGKPIIDDITADESAAPVQLGASQLEAVYLVETDGENDYLLVATHQPGSETEYGISAYWALPPVKPTT